MEHRLQRDLSSFTIDSNSAQNAREMSKSVVLQYSFTANGYAQPSGDLLLVRPRVVGRNARPYNDKPRTYPIDLGETGTWRDTYRRGFARRLHGRRFAGRRGSGCGLRSYKSEVKAEADVLHYSREYVVRALDLAPEKSADVSKLMGVINADENSSAVLKKK